MTHIAAELGRRVGRRPFAALAAAVTLLVLGVALYLLAGERPPPAYSLADVRVGATQVPRAFLSDVRKVSERAPVVHYVDDYHVFARTEDELLPIAQTLQSEFSQHPAGPLLLKRFIIKDARRGFVALGWLFKVRDGRVSIRPPPHKLENCLKKFDKKLYDAVNFGKGTPEDARESMRKWCESHRLWRHVKLWERLLLARLDSVAAPR